LKDAPNNSHDEQKKNVTFNIPEDVNIHFMKRFLSFIIPVFLISLKVTAQNLPTFLNGTWKMENKDTYEHWDILNENTLKGLSYKTNEGKFIVTEYLEINKTEEGIIYTATVLNQNRGAGIDFKLVRSDSVFSFENQYHDFPKFIQYTQVSENSINVKIGSKEDAFTLIFNRVK
jgi:hypothetical protein